MALGFVTTTPTVRYGDVSGTFVETELFMQKYACGGTGSQEISEIGSWSASNGAITIRLAIFTDDAANGCPDAMVDNSDSGAKDLSSETIIKVSHAYVTRPVLTGGTNYWICCIQSGNHKPSAFASGSNKYKTGITYPTWPTGDAWHTTSAITADWGLYAVYAATGQFARPSSDVAGGTFRSILVTAPFGPRVIA